MSDLAPCAFCGEEMPGGGCSSQERANECEHLQSQDPENLPFDDEDER